MSRLRPSLAVALLGAAFAAGSAAPASAAPVTPVPSLDVPRYLGTWFQVAAIPQWFEAACLRDVTANYRLNDDGSVRVVNRCAGPYGTPIIANGRARVLDTATNAQLQVSFIKTGTTFAYPDRAPNYIVFGLGASYDYAVVGDPGRSSGFLLSRTPGLSKAQYDGAIAALKANGYDPCKLRVTRQTAAAPQPVVSLCSYRPAAA